METTMIRGTAAEKEGFEASGWLKGAWMNLVEGIAEAMRMTSAEKERIRASRTAQLVGAIPFAAGCRKPERTALAHLATYVIAARNGMSRRSFDHTPEDDVSPYARLQTGMTYDGGDGDVLAVGNALLALNALQGYEGDQVKDRASGEYNPLVSGAWDFVQERAQLLEEIHARRDGGLLKLIGEPALLGFWGD